MHILYLHQEVRTNVNEWMRLSPIPFHRWKYPVAGPGMEKTLKDACSLWSRPVVWERNSNTQPRSLCCGPRRRTRAPGLGESYFEKTGGGGLMQKAGWSWRWCWTWHPDTVTRFSVQHTSCGDLPGGSGVKNLPATPETWVRSLSWEDPLEKGKATHSSILAWRIPWRGAWRATVRGGCKESRSRLVFFLIVNVHLDSCLIITAAPWD